jgi:hypothetical protein
MLVLRNAQLPQPNAGLHAANQSRPSDKPGLESTCTERCPQLPLLQRSHIFQHCTVVTSGAQWDLTVQGKRFQNRVPVDCTVFAYCRSMHVLQEKPCNHCSSKRRDPTLWPTHIQHTCPSTFYVCIEDSSPAKCCRLRWNLLPTLYEYYCNNNMHVLHDTQIPTKDSPHRGTFNLHCCRKRIFVAHRVTHHVPEAPQPQIASHYLEVFCAAVAHSLRS